MPCRVGVTTDPIARKAYWEKQVIGLSNWRILATYKKKSEAVEHVERNVAKYNSTDIWRNLIYITAKLL